MKVKRHHVKKGEAFLKGMSKEEIEQECRKESAGKPRERLMAALFRRGIYSLKDIDRTLGHSQSTMHEWLYRFDTNGLHDRHDNKSTGRPLKLSAVQQEEIQVDLCEDPVKSGYASSVLLVTIYVRNCQSRPRWHLYASADYMLPHVHLKITKKQHLQRHTTNIITTTPS